VVVAFVALSNLLPWWFQKIFSHKNLPRVVLSAITDLFLFFQTKMSCNDVDEYTMYLQLYKWYKQDCVEMGKVPKELISFLGQLKAKARGPGNAVFF
jgi:hypothetical protein